MSATPDDGGAAFPQHAFTNNNGEVVTPSCYFPDVSGMTLRDWFAGQALAGLLACPTIVNGTSSEQYSIASYKLADLMLAARKGGQQ